MKENKNWEETVKKIREELLKYKTGENTIERIVVKKKKKGKKKSKKKSKKCCCVSYESLHTGCPSYPNCDEAPLGCSVLMGDDVEWYGHKD